MMLRLFQEVWRVNMISDNIKTYFKVVASLVGLKVDLPEDTPLDLMKLYLKVWFFKKTGKILNLDNPKTFNEKIQWMKLYDSTPIKTRLADKYLVRDWVKEKIGKAFAQNPENQAEVDAEGEQYLIPLLGVWDNFDDIDFDKLPDRFVLKCNHGCAYNIIVKDKSKFDIEKARKKVDKWMKENYAYRKGLQMQYRDIPPKITAEEYIEDSNKELNDYKILCFNGKPEFIWIDQGRFGDRTENIYNMKWELQPFLLTYPNSKAEVPPPQNFEKMIEIAKVLSEGFAQVRVDFYNVDGKIYFGEMTFTSCNGIDKFIPESYNTVLGDMIKLPELKEPELTVSLTSFPYRIPTIHKTIKSLLEQTHKADRVVLQLSEDEFPNKEGDLPETLLSLRQQGLTINWVKGNIKSYKKLVPTLKQYPHDIIITVDDDRIYDKNMVKRLYDSYVQNPDFVHCHRTTKIFLKNGKFKAKGLKCYNRPSFANKLVGCGGVLYPPNILYKDVTDEKLFTTLAPTNDDIWFWLMAVMNDVKIKVVKHNIPEPKEISETKDGPCLTKINDNGEELFYKDLERVLGHYDGLREKIIADM